MNTKIVKLTALNVEALNLMAPGHTSLLETTKTTATFVGLTAYEALGVVQRMRETAGERYGRKGGSYQALHAVVRKLLTLAEAEQANEDRMRAESAKVEAQRDAGTLAAGLAAAKARSEARAEADAANDPLVTLLGTDPRTGMAYGAAIRPKAWVTAHVDGMAEPVAEVAGAVATIAEHGAVATRVVGAFRTARQVSHTRTAGTAVGRLLAASKVGQRRPKRGRRG